MKNRTYKKTNKPLLLLAVAVIMLLCFLLGTQYAALREAKSPTINIDGGSNTLGTGTMVEVTKDEIETVLKPISELSAYSQEYTVSLSQKETNVIFEKYKIPFTSNTIELTCTGIVKVGYDFKDIQIDVKDKTIEITLPRPQVNDNYIIWDKVECSEKHSIFNPIEFEQYKEMFAEIEERGLKEAVAQGIFTKAETNLKLLMNGFLAQFEGYEIAYK